MIKEIHDEKYYSFSEELKSKINEQFGDFLKKVETFFSKRNDYKKNFSVYVRQTDYFNQSRNKFYFTIELDDHTLLDLDARYIPEKNEITEIKFRATLPYHKTWEPSYFHDISFSLQEREILAVLQETFRNTLKNEGIRLLIDIEEFNPDQDTLPEAVVEFEKDGVKTEKFLQDEKMENFLTLYYDYCKLITRTFEEKEKELKIKR